ncbi:photosynthetic NDH subunit of lumenal location 3, chloroplastic-like protein [Cinnamomum micranthum f. kanehirae]|uniref:Photosynthetic NDH subunit of lumenal location 3, chloroplastic-like protein n=1 Tax=Cinnamomum micranthum f. kanehirae TaxID=337451 RepID=A0A3S3NRE8_9MAGN|nr:photosynthetic NDH subunit of lumenal location 3, chloroplastic-like protein [Cinnamomum micranthum f. kanehirae]
MNTEWKGSAYRIKKCATDLLSVGDLIEDDEEDSWDLMGRDIRLKSTFLYCDFNQVISNAPQELKKPLLELANKLFHYIEELDNAVKIRNISLTQSRYEDAALVLQEVMSVMP